MTKLIQIVMLVLVATLLAPAAVAQDVSPEERLEAEDLLAQANEAASRSKFTVAVPKYRKVLELAHGAHPIAYYNLAEVQKVRGECVEAVKIYELYASTVGTEEARREADAGIAKCKKAVGPRLHIVAEPVGTARIYIDDILASTSGEFGPAALPKGEYQVRLEADDHHPKMRTVGLSDEDVKLEVKLEEMTFFGSLMVKTEAPGARVRIFEGPSMETRQLYDLRTPLEEPVKLEEGKHFVEVTAEGYDRWIRNVSVGRDDEAVIEVKLNRSLPPGLKQ